MGEILFATTNPHKKIRFQEYYSPLGLKVVNFADLGLLVEVEEDGETPEENALKKALAGFNAIQGKMPVFGLDYWLEIEKFPKDRQPGANVRRIKTSETGQREAVNDEELLRYFIKELEKVGGESRGFWTSAIALIIKPDKIFTERFTRETFFTSIPSRNSVTAGEPLNSIQIVPETGKYFNELESYTRLEMDSKREKGYIEFMRTHLNELT